LLGQKTRASPEVLFRDEQKKNGYSESNSWKKHRDKELKEDSGKDVDLLHQACRMLSNH
jgi:hypothetical protein